MCKNQFFENKTLPIFLFIIVFLFNGGFLIAQTSKSISIVKKRIYCYEKEETLPFSTTGEFPNNEVFYLYSWRNNDFEIIDSTTTLAFKIPKSVNAQKYYFNELEIVSKLAGVSSGKFDISPNIIIGVLKYEKIKACEASSVVLKLSADSKLENIQWKKDGKELTNANNEIFNANETGIYTVSASSSGCPITFNNDKIFVTIGQIEKPYIQSNITKICNGSSITLKGNYTSKDSLFNYTWLKDGSEVLNQKTPYLEINATGKYQLKISQGNCVEFSNSLDILVGEEITAPTIINSYNMHTVSNKEIKICPSLIARIDWIGNLNNLPQDSKITWEKDGKEFIKNLNSYNSLLLTTEAGQYRLKLSINDCIAYSNSIKVSHTNNMNGLRIRLETNGMQGNSMCLNDSAKIYISDTNETLYFNRKLIDSVGIKVYKNGLFFRNSKIYQNTYLKEGGQYSASLNIKLPNQTQTCNFVSDTVKLEVANKILLEKINYNPVCSDSLKLQFNYDKNVTSQWKFNNQLLKDNTQILYAKNSGIYQYTATTNKGCIKEYEPTNIQLNKISTAIQKVNLNNICENTNQELNLNFSRSSYGTNNEYNWYKNGEFNGKGFSTKITSAGWYKLVQNTDGCTASDSVNIQILAVVKQLLPALDSVGICMGDIIKITAPQANSYTWFWEKTLLDETSNSIKASNTGTYKVIIDDGTCVGISKPIRVIQKNIPPTAALSGGGQVLYGTELPLKIDFTSSAPWIFKVNDLPEISTEENPYLLKVNSNKSETFELKSVKNGCGEGSVSGKAVISVILAEEKIKKNAIQIFPNPSSNFIIIQASFESNKPIFYKLLTIDGKQLQSGAFKQALKCAEEKIDLGAIPVGYYLLQVQIGEKSNTYKILKN